jgi:hypothetical protein
MVRRGHLTIEKQAELILHCNSARQQQMHSNGK